MTKKELIAKLKMVSDDHQVIIDINDKPKPVSKITSVLYSDIDQEIYPPSPYITRKIEDMSPAVVLT